MTSCLYTIMYRDDVMSLYDNVHRWHHISIRVHSFTLLHTVDCCCVEHGSWPWFWGHLQWHGFWTSWIWWSSRCTPGTRYTFTGLPAAINDQSGCFKWTITVVVSRIKLHRGLSPSSVPKTGVLSRTQPQFWLSVSKVNTRSGVNSAGRRHTHNCSSVRHEMSAKDTHDVALCHTCTCFVQTYSVFCPSKHKLHFSQMPSLFRYQQTSTPIIIVFPTQPTIYW